MFGTPGFRVWGIRSRGIGFGVETLEFWRAGIYGTVLKVLGIKMYGCRVWGFETWGLGSGGGRFSGLGFWGSRFVGSGVADL